MYSLQAIKKSIYGTAATSRRSAAARNGWRSAKAYTPTTKLSGQEFLRLFLEHVLPPGFTRVRHFGFLSYAAKKTYAEVQAALAERKNVLTKQEPPPSPSASDLTLTTEPKPIEPHKHCCPRCNVVMKFGEFWPANKAGRSPPGYALKPGQGVQCKLALQFT